LCAGCEVAAADARSVRRNGITHVRIIWVKTLLFTLVVPGTTLALVPCWILATGAGGRLSLGVFRWLGLLPLLAGVAGLASCYVAFAIVGRGTPSPLDPPRMLVAGGLYRFVRNPIYLSAVLVLVGEAVLWQAPALVLYAGLFWVGSHLFVIGYEEPRLRRRFGPSYGAYSAAVPRWVPQRPRANAPVSPSA
jgi:protein-S-isoprenylcysteine O-methyltransferase Ste14